MRPRNFLIALPLAALTIAGCGGGGSSTASTPSVTTAPTTASLSKAEYIKQGDAICAEVNAAVGATGSASSSGSSSQVGQVADIYTGMVTSLKGLGTPEGADNSEFISAAEELSKAEGEAKLADERGDSGALGAAETSATSAIVSFQSAAQAFGFTECGEGPSAPSTGSSTTTPSSSSTAPSTTTTTPTTVAPEPESAPAPNTGGAGGTAEAEAPATGGGTAGGGTTGGGGSSSGGIGPG